MGQVAMIRRNNAQIQYTLALDKATRDALADYCRRRWPVGTAKACARAFELTADEGRRVIAAKASQTTIDKVFKVGGWGVILAVYAEVIGFGADQYFREMGRQHAEHGAEIAEIWGDFRSWSDRRDVRGGSRPGLGDHSDDAPCRKVGL